MCSALSAISGTVRQYKMMVNNVLALEYLLLALNNMTNTNHGHRLQNNQVYV